MTHRAKAEAAACPPHAPSILSLCLCFGFFLLWLVGSFLVDAMQYASWGSVSFVSVESACRHYGVSMTSPMTSLTSLGVMFRNLEESRSRSLHVRQKISTQFTTLQPWLRPDRCVDPPGTFETTSCCVAVRKRTGHVPVTSGPEWLLYTLLLSTELPVGVL